MAICLAVIGACLSFAEGGNRKPAYGATAFIFLYNTFFATGWLGTTWSVRICISWASTS